MPRTVSKGSASIGRTLRASRTWAGASLLLACALAFAACDHATDGIDGPFLVDRFGDFTLIEPLVASQATVDFAGGETVTFEATFNKQSTWTIVIVGQESGAVKRIEGFSREISDQNAVWDGGTTDLPFFRTEAVEATLLIDGAVLAESPPTAVEVTTPRVYPGNVVTGFEADDNANVVLGNFEFEFDLMATGPSMEIPAAEGELFYLLRSTGGPTVADPFFIGLTSIFPGAKGPTYFPVPTSIPEDLFFNAALYSFGTPNTIAVIQVGVDSNGNGVYNDGIDAVVSIIDQPVDWEGWRLFSIPFSDTIFTQEQLETIVAVRLLLISDNNGQPNPPLPVDYGVDFVTFTQGGPLEL
ncbi:MAG: hypothetical protein AAF624_02710 [Bacteroidota bacterium]